MSTPEIIYAHCRSKNAECCADSLIRPGVLTIRQSTADPDVFYVRTKWTDQELTYVKGRRSLLDSLKDALASRRIDKETFEAMFEGMGLNVQSSPTSAPVIVYATDTFTTTEATKALATMLASIPGVVRVRQSHLLSDMFYVLTKWAVGELRFVAGMRSLRDSLNDYRASGRLDEETYKAMLEGMGLNSRI